MEIAKVAGVTLGLNYGVHYMAASAYNYLCVPHSATDILQSLVTTASPLCSMMLEVMRITQGNYATVLVTTATAVIAGALRS